MAGFDASAAAQIGKRISDTPLYERLVQTMGRLSAMSGHVHAFEQRMNGNHPEPTPPNALGVVNAPRPVMSIEDVVSSIEQHIADIDGVHTRLAQRF